MTNRPHFGVHEIKIQSVKENKGECKEKKKEGGSLRWEGRGSFHFSFCGEFTQKGPSNPWSAEHIPVGWNQNPLWIILNMPCQTLHILPCVFFFNQFWKAPLGFALRKKKKKTLIRIPDTRTFKRTAPGFHLIWADSERGERQSRGMKVTDRWANGRADKD